MEMFITLFIGSVLGYIVRGWFRKNNQEEQMYYGHPEYPELFSHPYKDSYELPIKVTNTDFEQVWIKGNLGTSYGVERTLSDDDYIEYHIWEKKKSNEMYSKHMPNVKVVTGVHDNLTFHGGCLSCKSQYIHGVDRCKGCKYFKANWNLPDLTI